MNRQLSLATRAFLFAFIPMVLTLIASFVLVSKAVDGRIKGSLREDLQKTEAMLSRREAEYAQRNLKVLATLTENPSLKAGIGLLRDNRSEALREQVHETLANQLKAMGDSLDYDLLLLEDTLERPVVGVVGKPRSRLPQSQPITFFAPSLIQVDGTLYEAVSVPINLGDENLGSLVVGKEFSAAGWNEFGKTALIQNGKVLRTTFAREQVPEIEKEMDLRCATSGECEVQVGDETYLALPVRQETFKSGAQFISFQSVDSATREFTDNLASLFPMVGGVGVLLVLLFSAVGARSIARPLERLIAQLRSEGSAGGFTAALKPEYRSAEVNELALEFTKAAGAVRDSERQLDEATEQFIESMAQAQDARDPYTAGHSERVSVTSTLIAESMGLSSSEVEIIRIGAKLHDIGKIGVPDAVLRKPGKLTAEERLLIQRHPQTGKEILEKVGRFRDFLPIVELHHENPDGSGYPYGLRKDDIPIGVRIVHVADVFDAITSDRAYRPAMSQESAWKLLLDGMGPLFDPEVVEAMWTVLRREPGPRPPGKIIVPHDNDLAFYTLPVRTT